MKLIKSSKGWAIGDTDSHIGVWVEDSGKLAHDEHLIPLACTYIREGDCVIDCGANIGSHTIEYCKKVGAKGVVVAIEPGSVAFDCLMHNTDLFPFKNVFPIKAALSDHDGQTVTHEQNINLGASTCIQVKDEDRVKGQSYLLTVTLDFIANQLERTVNFIKLDIEGWEVAALVGAARTLKKDKPTLLIEVNSSALEKNNDTTQDLLDVLKFNNYTYSICQPNCTLQSPQFDIIAQPSTSLPSQ